MTVNYWGNGTGTSSYYGNLPSGSTEPDLRQELWNMFNGVYPEVSKAQTGLIRRMTRDASGNLTPCPCVDSMTGEPDKDRFCPICFGEGYLWEESYIQFYRTLTGSSPRNTHRDNLVPPGLINIPLVVFYIKYNNTIGETDKVVLVNVDVEGNVIEPATRTAIYSFDAIWDYRSDRGRLEYYKGYGHLDNVKWLNAPGYTDQV
tara:strand:+ start:754 stop:1362 length:609 start_codon:yes stop_codon:yes gene_type:complete